MGTDDKLIYNVIVNSEKWKVKEFSIQGKSLILDPCYILYLDITMRVLYCDVIFAIFKNLYLL